MHGALIAGAVAMTLPRRMDARPEPVKDRQAVFVGPGMPTPGGVVDVGVVERIPRILGGAPAPRYPGALRVSGVSGRVVVRFVVDTVGRAELDGVVVMEATHALFVDAVQSALGLYRFSPGEIGGRKVRTMVQLPFTFTLRP